MPHLRQVFISHATEHDGVLAHRIADDLVRMNIPVWIAPDSIRGGETWVEAIERGLQESSHMAILLTPAALDSSWVRKEIAAGIMLERRERIELVPLDVEPCEAPLLLSTYQLIDFRQDYGTAMRQLARHLGGVVSPPPRAAASPVRPVTPPPSPRAVPKATRAALVQQVAVILADILGLDPSDIHETSDLSTDLGMDELDLIEIIMAVEEHFGVEIPDSDIYDDSRTLSTDGLRLRSVRDLANYLAQRVPDTAAPQVAPASSRAPGKLTCSVCGLPFNREADLRTHMENWHGRAFTRQVVRMSTPARETVKGPTAPRAAFVCPICRLGFNRESDLVTHMENWHSGKP
ncbi:MAG: TIR domain-containing protein [Caldilinea sp.]